MERKTTTLEKLLVGSAIRRLRENLPKFARLGVFLACVWGVAMFFAGRQAKADVNEVMLGLGAQMMHYGGADEHGAPRTLFLNGQRMYMATASTTHDVAKVLDYYEARCMRRDGGFSQQIQEIMQRELPAAPAVPESALDATLRAESRARGYVACLDTGRAELTTAELASRIAEFNETGDLGRVGHIRYVFTERNAGRTHIVAMWTEDTFNVREMVPATGDVTGPELRNVPRPAGSRRILAAWEDGQPQTMTVFASSTASAAAIEQMYRETLPRSGWELTEPSAAQHEGAENARVLSAEDGERSVLIVIGEDEQHHGWATLFSEH